MTELISRQQLAAQWNQSVDTLTYWNKIGYGPRSARIGRQCYYRVADVENFVSRAFADA
jgi:hypothetical protein